jgi:hypothetical protein
MTTQQAESRRGTAVVPREKKTKRPTNQAHRAASAIVSEKSFLSYYKDEFLSIAPERAGRGEGMDSASKKRPETV